MVYTEADGDTAVNIPKLQRNRPEILSFKSMAVSLALVFCSIRMMLAPDPPLVIGQRKQLLVDDYILASTSRLDRQLGEVVKHPHPVLLPDRRWDDPSAFGGYLTVLRNQPADKFQMWYMAGEENGIGYAESEDGIHWTKPRVSSDGKTNIVFNARGHMSVSIDPHETDPRHRYKAAYYGPGVMAALAHSADGIHWSSYNDGQPVTGRAADTHNQILWDPLARVYRLYTRSDFGDDDVNEWRGNRCMVNPDVKADPTDWTTLRSWKFDREGASERWRRQIYGLTDWIYQGLHFALMSVYEFPPRAIPPPYAGKPDYRTRHQRDIMNFYIGTSRDGDHWDLGWVYDAKPMIRRGPEGSFDKDMIMPASQIVTWKDRHWIYYGAGNERHWCSKRQNAIGLATLPLDRWVALAATEDAGELVTKPFRLEGDRLEVNVDARRGEFRVEVLDPIRGAIEGFGRDESKQYAGVDELRLRPGWKRFPDLKRLRGRVVQLKFTLKQAKLYAFQIRSDERGFASDREAGKKDIHEGARRTTKTHEERLKAK